MATGNLKISANQATLTEPNGNSTAKTFIEVESLELLIVGSDVLANDSICYLIKFHDQLWLIPEVTPGAIDLKTWATTLETQSKTKVHLIDYLPRRWRTKFLFISGIEARLQILPLPELEKHSHRFTELKDKKITDLI